MASKAEFDKLFAWKAKESSWFYTGDLRKAKKLLSSEGVETWEGKLKSGLYSVSLSLGSAPAEPAPGEEASGDVYGRGKTADEAWRYAFAAHMTDDSTGSGINGFSGNPIWEDVDLKGLL